MCILPAKMKSGITKLPNKYGVPLIALQANLLQVGMLYFLSTQLVNRADLHEHYHELPGSIVFIAIYLHFMNCTQELPYSWQLFHYLPDFHEDLSDLIVMAAVLIMDSFLVPLLSLFLGGLYLCTSRSIGDVILNAVAVAFVHDIDNWILGLNVHVNFLAGQVTQKTVHIPTNRSGMQAFAWGFIYTPVVPIVVSAGFYFLGFHVLML